MSHYTVHYKYGKRTHDFLGHFYGCFSFVFYILGAFSIKQLFYSYVYVYEMIIANSYPTHAHGIIVDYFF